MRSAQFEGCRGATQSRSAALVCYWLVALVAVALPSTSAAAQASAPQLADTAGLARVTGTVYDSVANTPLAGAQVQLVVAVAISRQYMTVADSLGRFAFDAIPPGKYIAGFFHPSLDLLEMESPLRTVTVTTGAPETLNLAIPAASHLIVSLCGKQTVSDSLGAIVGRVRGADSRLPVEGARVMVSWLQLLVTNGKITSSQRSATTTTDIDGAYRMCGLPGADTLFATVEFAASHAGTVSVGIPAGGITRRDFTIGDSSTSVPLVLDSTSGAEIRKLTTVLRGSSTLMGFVRDANGKGLPGAIISVSETGLTSSTDSTGYFSLSGLPAGTFSVQARAIGREWRVTVVDLAPNSPAHLDFKLDKQIQTLSRVTIFGKATKNRADIDEFLKRKASGFGRFITADDPTLKHAFDVTDVLRMVPGIRIVSVGPFQSLVVIGAAVLGCPATIFVDGIKLNPTFESIDDIPPNRIQGIEIYASALETPPRFTTLNPCGAVVIWKKH